MKRSTNTAPVSLSTSYLMGSPCIGISITTLQSCGTSLPAVTRSRRMAVDRDRNVAARGRPRFRRERQRYHASRKSRAHAYAIECTPSGGRNPFAISPDMPKLTLVLLLAAAPAVAQAPSMESAPLVPPFSAARAGPALPSGWLPIKINEQKKPTVYDLVDDQGTVVLHAVADGAASLVGYRVAFDLKAAPVLSWRWKVSRLIATADNAVAGKEDSPARIVLEFDGDKSKISGARSAKIQASLSVSPY